MTGQPPTDDARRLAEIVAGHRVVVVCGTGGVGKTTVSAALALGAALDGHRALVMTIDPARRLADALGVTGKLNEATEIDLATLLPGVPVREGGALHAMMLDPKSTFDGVVRRFSKDEETVERVLSNHYYQRASASLGGTQEYMAMEQLLEVERTGDYDLIVLDTPPSRNALDFLQAPGKLLRVMEEGVLTWLQPGKGKEFSSASAGMKLFGKGRKAMFSVLERLMGMDVIHGISDFLGAFQGMLDGFRGRAREVMELLRGDRTAFLMVASPSRVALSEALYFHDRLAAAEIPFRGFVINRTKPVEAGGGDLPADAAAAGLPVRDDDPEWSRLADAVWKNHRRRARWAAVDRHHIDALRDHCGPDLPYVQVPELEGEVHDLDALRRMLEYLR